MDSLKNNLRETPHQDFFAHLVEHIPYAIFVRDISADCRVKVWNKAAEELLGISQDKIIGHSLYDFFPKEQVDFLKRIDDLVVSGRRAIDIPEEYFNSLIHGNILLHTHKIPLFNEQNQITSILTISENITQRKRQELEIRSSEALFRNLAKSAPIGIYKTDKEGKCVFVNEQWEKISGMKQSESFEDGWSRALHPQDRKKIFDLWQGFVTRSDHFFAEYRFLHADGKVVWVLGSAVPIREESFEVTGFVGTILDITEQRLAQQTLESQNDLIRKTMALAEIGGVKIDLSAKAVRLTTESAQLLRQKETISLDQFKKMMDVGSSEIFQNQIDKVFQLQQSIDLEIKIDFFKQESRWFRLSVSVENSGDGQFFLTGFLQDITQRKNLEIDLLKKEKQAKLLMEVSQLSLKENSFDVVLKETLTLISQYFDWDLAHAYIPDLKQQHVLVPSNIWYVREGKNFDTFINITKNTNFKIGMGLPGKVLEDARPMAMINCQKEEYFLRKSQQDAGVYGAAAVCVVSRGQISAVLEFFKDKEYLIFNDDLVFLQNVASQIGHVLERKIKEDEVIERNKLLEHMNQMMVDRELKMIELKRMLAQMGIDRVKK